MSPLSERRDEYAQALSTVNGIRGFAYRPTAPRTGDAWPVLLRAERDETSGQFYVRFAVGVCLPQDERGANAYIDTNADAIIDGLESADVGYVESFEPANFGDANSFMYGLLFTMRGD